MKKQYIYTICAILLLAIAIVGSTYAFFSASEGSNNNAVFTESQYFAVIYTGGTTINGPLNLTSDRSGGANTTVHIKVAEGSYNAIANLYINIDNITDNLASNSVKWEVSGVKNNVEVYTNSGTFAGYNSTNNNKVMIVNNYRLTEEQTDFTVYIWIDGNLAGNEVLGGNFSGYIGASTEQVTGVLH